MKLINLNDEVVELDQLMELIIDKPLPHPLDGVCRVYEIPGGNLLQKLVVDGIEQLTIVDLQGAPRLLYFLDLVRREGVEVLLANAYIDRAIETYGVFDGAARVEAYELPAATNALNFLKLTIRDDVLDELHSELVDAKSPEYPLSPR